MSETELIPADFSGIVRLFPLPDLVMFPHVVQALRIFEPRYVEMFEHALADDHLLAMALLQPGWESAYEANPAVYATVCVGRVLSHNRQPDGSYNLLLAGAARARIIAELPKEFAYRRAQVQLVTDPQADAGLASAGVLRTRMLRAFKKLTPGALASDPAIQQMLQKQVRLEVLVDVISFAVPLKRLEKQELLEEPSVAARALKLIEHLDRLSKSARSSSPAIFPPVFSDN